MNPRSTSVSLLVFAIACSAPPPTPTDASIQLPTGTATLDVQLTNVRNATGSVRCTLFASAEGFPGASPLIDGTVLQPASPGVMQCHFDAPPTGDYAVSVLHDENGNGTLDRSVFGAPTEGYGASNNQLPAMAPPTFDASRVHLDDGQQLGIDVTLHY